MTTETNPWLHAAQRRLGRYNRETLGERAYRLHCATLDLDVIEQYPVGKFRLDFFHKQWNCAVEIDGPLHETAYGQRKDRQRDAALHRAGIRHIVRLGYRATVQDPAGAVARVLEHLKARGVVIPSPEETITPLAPTPLLHDS